MDGYISENISDEQGWTEFIRDMEGYERKRETRICSLCKFERTATARNFDSAGWVTTSNGNIACPRCIPDSIDRHVADRIGNRQMAEWHGTTGRAN